MPTSKDGEARARVRAYIAALPPAARRHLKTLRAAIQAAAPGAADAFSYGIPAIRLDGALVVYYAGWKRHSSMYPITPALIGKYQLNLDDYDTSKGTVRFPHAETVPVGLVRRLVKARLAEVRAASPARRVTRRRGK